MIGSFPAVVLNFTDYLSNSTGSSVTNCRFSLIIAPKAFGNGRQHNLAPHRAIACYKRDK